MKSRNGVLCGFRQAFSVTVALMLICGFFFPCLLSGLSSVIFPRQAEGSLIIVDGKAVGAEFVGQEFTKDFYMHSRPSAYRYNVYKEDESGAKYYNDGSEFAGLGSGSNNYAPANPALAERVAADMESFIAKNPGVKREDIPADLVTASGSGLDPHISPAAAEIQIPRIAKASGISEETLRQIVRNNTDGKVLGIFGEDKVNVLKVNIEIAQRMKLL